MADNLSMIDVIRACASQSGLKLPTRTEAEARAAKAAKAFEFAKNNPNPSCKWSQQHLTSQYGNWCSMCGTTDMPPAHFYPAKAKVIEYPKPAVDERVGEAGSLT